MYSALNTVEHRSGTGYDLYKIGKLVFCLVYYLGGGASPMTFLNIPFKPINAVRTALINNNDDSYAGQCVLSVENGSSIMRLWKSGGGTFPGDIVWTCSFCYITND